MDFERGFDWIINVVCGTSHTRGSVSVVLVFAGRTVLSVMINLTPLVMPVTLVLALVTLVLPSVTVILAGATLVFTPAVDMLTSVVFVLSAGAA